LLIEDYAPLRTSLAQGLRESGMAVDEAADGEAGLDLGLVQLGWEVAPAFRDTQAVYHVIWDKLRPPPPGLLDKLKLHYDYVLCLRDNQKESGQRAKTAVPAGGEGVGGARTDRCCPSALAVCREPGNRVA